MVEPRLHPISSDYQIRFKDDSEGGWKGLEVGMDSQRLDCGLKYNWKTLEISYKRQDSDRLTHQHLQREEKSRIA